MKIEALIGVKTRQRLAVFKHAVLFLFNRQQQIF